MMVENIYEFNGKLIMLMLCSSCNVKCKHCYISYSKDFEYNEANDLISALNEKYDIYLNGSEILAKPEYLPLFKKVGQKFIMTNGLAIAKNPDVLSMCKDNNIDTIRLSYHFSLHEQISPIPREMVLKVISLCKEYGMKVMIMASISKNNEDDIRSMCDEAYKLGANSIKFTNFLLQGAAKDNNLNSIVLNQMEINSVLEKIEECRSIYDPSELYIKRCGSFGSYNNSLKNNFHCPSITDSVVITPNMSVYPCVFRAMPGHEIGLCQNGKVLLFKNKLKYNNNVCLSKRFLNENIL